MSKTARQAERVSAADELNHLESPDSGDPLDMPLPCDIKIGHGTHAKGTSLRGLVMRARILYDMAQEQTSESGQSIDDVRKKIADIRLKQLQELLERGRACRCGPDGCADSECPGRSSGQVA